MNPQGHRTETGAFVAVVGSLLIGCAVLLVVGCSVGGSGAARGERDLTEVIGEEGGSSGGASEEDRCAGTRRVEVGAGFGGAFTLTNDVPGCPKGGVLSGTDKGDDFLTGSTVDEDGHDQGNDVLRGGSGSDSLNGFGGDDVIYGDDVERLWGGEGEDVLRGEDGDDFLDGTLDGGDRDELYCGEGKDEYAADKSDRVSGDCEDKVQMGTM